MIRNYLKNFTKKIAIHIQVLDLRLFLLKNKERIIFIDIDNTIADTEKFLKSINNEYSYKDLSKIDSLDGTINFLKKEYSKNHIFIFLTHRKLISRNITKSWLIAKNIWQEGARLYFVNEPNQKIIYFNEVLKINNDFVIIDDLSYGGEHNNVNFYYDIINFIKKNKIKHHDRFFIERINS